MYKDNVFIETRNRHAVRPRRRRLCGVVHSGFRPRRGIYGCDVWMLCDVMRPQNRGGVSASEVRGASLSRRVSCLRTRMRILRPVGRRGRKARAPVCLQGPSRGEVYLLAREALHRDSWCAGGLFGSYGRRQRRRASGCAAAVVRRPPRPAIRSVCGALPRRAVGSCAVGPECRDAVGLGVGHGQAEALVPFIFGVGAEARAVEEEYAAYVLYGACR